MFKKLSAILFGIVAFSVISQSAFAGMMLFVGDGCTHCANVEKYMEDNKIADKMEITIYEVWYNASNRDLYKQVAAKVGYTGEGVPLLINGMDYRSGDTPIISYFEEILAGKVKVIQAPLIETPKAEENSGYASVIDASNEPTTESNTLSEEDSEELNRIAENTIGYDESGYEGIKGIVLNNLKNPITWIIVLAIGATVAIIIKKKK